jgi:hypothetical protein
MIEKRKMAVGDGSTKNSAIAEEFVSLVRSAARLRHEITPYLRDRHSGGGTSTTYYAVDTNVLHLFLNPSRSGPRTSDGGSGYGVVFDDDDEQLGTILGGALSRYIFDHLTGPDNPLILLPGHDLEVRIHFERKTIEVDNEARRQAKQERDELAGRLHQLTSITDEDAKIKWLKDNAPRLFDYLFGDASPSAELRRFNYLLSRGRIVKLASAIARIGFFGTDVNAARRMRNAFSLPMQAPHLAEESSYYNGWVNRLKADKKKKGYRLENDASALARLELINRHLGQEHERLVMITGDMWLVEVAQEYFPEAKNGHDFATLYLRHPRAFLAAPEVLLPGEAEAAAQPPQAPKLLDDWLDTLLAPYTDEWGVSEELIREIALGNPERLRSLRERALNATKTNPAAAESIKAQWSEHTTRLRTAHTATSAVVRAEIIRVLGSKPDQRAEEVLSNLDRKLDEENEKSWDGVFQAVMQGGFELLALDEITDIGPRRNPPAISSGSFSKTREFVRKVMSSRGLDGVDQKQLTASLQSLDDDTGTDYVRALAYAVLFARANRWHVAVCVARRAIRIAERIKCEVSKKIAVGNSVAGALRNISGREAYYFVAIAQRLLALRRDDLDCASSLLDKAEIALEADRKLDEQPRPTDLRFKAERLTLKLSYYLFDRFVAPKPLVPLDESFLHNFFNELMALISRLESEADEWIRLYVERNLFNNIFFVAALMDYDTDLDQSHFELCESILKKFLQNIAPQDHSDKLDIPASRLANAVADYAFAKFGKPSPFERQGIAQRLELLKLDLENDLDSLKLTQYDPERFRLLAEMTQRALMTPLQT